MDRPWIVASSATSITYCSPCCQQAKESGIIIYHGGTRSANIYRPDFCLSPAATQRLSFACCPSQLPPLAEWLKSSPPLLHASDRNVFPAQTHPRAIWTVPIIKWQFFSLARGTYSFSFSFSVHWREKPQRHRHPRITSLQRPASAAVLFWNAESKGHQNSIFNTTTAIKWRYDGVGAMNM